MTRSRTKLIEQQVNSLLLNYDVCSYENFILPKSLHLCMIQVIDNTSIVGGKEHEAMEPSMGEHKERVDHGSTSKKEKPGAELVGVGSAEDMPYGAPAHN